MKSKIKKFLNKYNNMHEAAKASIWFVLCGFIQKGISVFTSPVFARLFSKEEYGQYNTFISWQGIIAVFITLRFSYGAYMQGLVKYDDDRERYTSSLLGLTAVIMSAFGVIYLIFRDTINGWLGLTTPMMGCMFIMLAMSVVFEFWSARERVDFRYKKLVFVTLTMSILNPVLGIIVVYLSKAKVQSRIIEIAIVEFCCYCPLLFLQLKKGKTLYVKKYWQHALLFSLPLIPHYLSSSILNQSDRVMIQKMVGDAEAGVYSLAYNIATLFIILNTSLGNVYGPWIFKSLKSRELEKTKKITNIMALLVAGMNFFLIICTPEAVLLFGSRKYYSAIWLMPPVSIGVYFMFINNLFTYILMGFQKTKYVLVASVSSALLNLGLNYLLIPQFGYIAAAYTTVICYILYAVITYIFHRIICKSELDGYKLYDMRFIILLSIAFCIGGILIMITYNWPIVRYSLIGVTCIFMVIFRKKLILSIKEIMSIKNKKEV